MKKITSTILMFSMFLSVVSGLMPKVVVADHDGDDQDDVVCEASSQTIFSDTETLVGDEDNPSVPVGTLNVSWTASIPGATWIWSEDPLSDTENETSETFSRTFIISGTPTGATLDIATDNSYSVSVNGNDVHADNTGSNFEIDGQDSFSIPVEHLQGGENVITFMVTNLAQAEGTQETNPAGLLYKLVVEECTSEETTATIVATKIVCDSEADLPNWGNNGPDITATTASDFLSRYDGSCHLQPWTFEWAPNGTENPGDGVEEAGGDWTPFTETTTIPAGALTWVREQFVDGYIPFSGAFEDVDNDTSKNSAEFYCNTDVLNYDNYEYIDPVEAGQTYYCIAFNVSTNGEGDPNPEPPTDSCIPRISVQDVYSVLIANEDVYFNPAVHKGGMEDWSNVNDGKPWEDSRPVDIDLTQTPGLTAVPTTPRALLITENEVYLHNNLSDLGAAEWLNFDHNAPWGNEKLTNTGVVHLRDAVDENLWMVISAGSEIYFLSTEVDSPHGPNTWVDISKNKPWGNSEIDDVDITGQRHVYVLTDDGKLYISSNPQSTTQSDWGLADPDSLDTIVGSTRFDGEFRPGTASVGDEIFYHLAPFHTLRPFEWFSITDNKPWGGNFIEDVSVFFFSQEEPWATPAIVELVAGDVPYLHIKPQDVTLADWFDVSYNAPWNDLGSSCNPHTNNAPTADAGVDETITLPTDSVNLDGSGSTDSDGTITSYVWSFVSGPSTIDPNDIISPSVGSLVAGTYVFKLTVTDNEGATGEDTMSITVNPEIIVENPACSDGLDNDDDGLIDINDPGCHSDGDVNNPDSYVPSDDDEANEVTQCSDGLDNDNDNKIDLQDPGCDSPEDDNETDSGSGGGGDGGGGGISGGFLPRGQVLGAEASCGIYVDKFLRKGYDNNVESVKKVQMFLNDYMQSGLVVDGIYGSKTEAAVNAFQVKHTDKVLTPWGITQPTGIFYLTTQTEVNNIACPTLNLAIPSNLIPFQTNSQAPIAVLGPAIGPTLNI